MDPLIDLVLDLFPYLRRMQTNAQSSVTLWLMSRLIARPIDQEIKANATYDRTTIDMFPWSTYYAIFRAHKSLIIT